MSVAQSPQILRLYRGMLFVFLLALPFAFIYNLELFNWLNCRKDATLLNFFFLTLTSLADGFWIMMLATVVQSIAPRNFKAFLIALVLGNILLQSAKYFVDADRPLRVLSESAICLLGQPLTVRSFPSGHAFSVGLFFMFLRPSHSSVGALALLSITLLAAVSRVYIGVHFPRDIAIGFLLAVFSFLVAEIVAQKITFRDASLTLRKALVAFLGVGTALLYLFAYHEKTTELEPLLTPAAWLVVLYWLLYCVARFRPIRSGGGASGELLQASPATASMRQKSPRGQQTDRPRKATSRKTSRRKKIRAR